MTNSYTNKEVDILKEVINIGGGRVATSLSKIFDEKVHMDVPMITRMSYEEVFEKVTPAEKVVKAVQIQIHGDMDGQFLLLMDEEGILSLDQMYSETFKESTELANSAISELANILVNQFLQAIAQLLSIQVKSSVPHLTEDMFGSLVASAYLEEFQYEDKVWIFKNEFLIKNKKWDSSLYFVPKPGVLEEIINNID